MAIWVVAQIYLIRWMDRSKDRIQLDYRAKVVGIVFFTTVPAMIVIVSYLLNHQK